MHQQNIESAQPKTPLNLLCRKSWISLKPDEIQEIAQQLTEDELQSVLYNWTLWAREEQLPPLGDWQFWSYIAGRGAGKTRTGAEFTRNCVNNGCKRIALVAPTHDDFHKVMVEGESGVLNCCPPWDMPDYNQAQKTLTWKNGAQAFGYSAEKPDRLRGPQHDAAWVDEIAGWHPKRRQRTWDMLMFGLRLGDNPRCMVSTTPLPDPVIIELIENARDGDPAYALTTGSTYSNRANLSKQFFSRIITKYEGTRLGDQELLGKLLTDIPGALWTLDTIRPHYVGKAPRTLEQVIVAVDPSGAADAESDSDEIGIVVAARDNNKEYYVLDDRTILGGPNEWSHAAVKAYHDYNADKIVAETNFGGEMVINTIKQADENVKTKRVTASRGKAVRAEPISLLYEQGKVHHVGDSVKFSKLEDQFCSFTNSGYVGADSPDRADAAIWALSELSGQKISRVYTTQAAI